MERERSGDERSPHQTCLAEMPHLPHGPKAWVINKCAPSSSLLQTSRVGQVELWINR